MNWTQIIIAFILGVLTSTAVKAYATKAKAAV